ncbi:MAG: hypothetical protein ACOCV4_02245 [Myxococcota bacterium]
MRKIIGSTLVFFLAACGEGEATGATEPDPMEMESTGGELGMGEEPEEASGQEVAQPTGKANLTVQITVGGEQVQGDVQVLDDEGKVVHEGSSGDVFSVPAGAYTLVGKVNDASILVDTPTEETDSILVEPGEDRTEDVEIGRAKVRLKIYDGRRHVRRAEVQLRREGGDEVVYEFTPGKEHIAISPGRYDALVKLPDDSEVEVDGLIFMPGATQEIPLRIE